MHVSVNICSKLTTYIKIRIWVLQHVKRSGKIKKNKSISFHFPVICLVKNTHIFIYFFYLLWIFLGKFFLKIFSDKINYTCQRVNVFILRNISVNLSTSPSMNMPSTKIEHFNSALYKWNGVSVRNMAPVWERGHHTVRCGNRVRCDENANVFRS